MRNIVIGIYILFSITKVEAIKTRVCMDNNTNISNEKFECSANERIAIQSLSLSVAWRDSYTNQSCGEWNGYKGYPLQPHNLTETIFERCSFHQNCSLQNAPVRLCGLGNCPQQSFVDIEYSCERTDWNVVDICNDTFQTFSGGGHIIYSENNVSHRSCDCSVKGATTISIREYNPYHNDSTCFLDRLVINENRFSNIGKLNSDNICFTVYNTLIPGEPGDTNITLNLDDEGAPKRLWISFEGNDVTVLCNNYTDNSNTSHGTEEESPSRQSDDRDLGLGLGLGFGLVLLIAALFAAVVILRNRPFVKQWSHDSRLKESAVRKRLRWLLRKKDNDKSIFKETSTTRKVWATGLSHLVGKIRCFKTTRETQKGNETEVKRSGGKELEELYARPVKVKTDNQPTSNSLPASQEDTVYNTTTNVRVNLPITNDTYSHLQNDDNVYELCRPVEN